MHPPPQTAASAPALTQGRWTMDANHSAVTFAIRHLGLSKVRGRFRVFDVSLTIGPSTTDFEVVANIDLASIDTSNPDRDALADKVAFELEMQFVQPPDGSSSPPPRP